METSEKVRVYRFREGRDGYGNTYCVLLPVADYGDEYDLIFKSLNQARQWCLDNGHGFLDPDE